MGWRAEEDPIDWLRSEYLRKRAVNQAYSLRAFARSLQINSGRLSDFLSKKRALTPEMGDRIATRLSFPPEKKERFLSLLQEQQQKKKVLGNLSTSSRQKFRRLPRTGLTKDEYHLIAEWFHFAILNLIETKGFRSQAPWIAKRLGISPVAVRGALERLERMGLLTQVEGEYVPTRSPLTTGDDVGSVAVNTFHFHSLKQAADAIKEVPVELRDNPCVTMAIDVSKIPIAKKIIKNFRRKLCELLEDGERTEVYNLQVLLYPVTKKGPT